MLPITPEGCKGLGRVLTVPAPGEADDLTRVVHPTAPGAAECRKGPGLFHRDPFLSARKSGTWTTGEHTELFRQYDRYLDRAFSSRLASS